MCSMKKFIILLISILIFAVGCQKKDSSDTFQSVSETGFYFDTVVTITLYGDYDTSFIDSCFSLCEHYENLFSRTIPSSEISILNKQKNIFASNETLEIIEESLYFSELTNGNFDITLASLSEIWNFTGADPKIPDSEQIQSKLLHVGYKNIQIYENNISLTSPDTRIDMGGIAKGFIADKLKEHLLSLGVEHGLIDLGGNILMFGGKPDNSSFKIGIQKPFEQRNEILYYLKAKNLSVVSSGIYERYFYENDTLYHHILDPKTGFPVSNGLISVTILSENSTLGDALSTGCFVMGPEEGMNLINSLDNTEAVFIFEDYSSLLSSGLKLEGDTLHLIKTSPGN